MNKHHKAVWRCKCDCGTIFDSNSQSVITGKSKSCGCYSRKMASIRLKEVNKHYKGKSHPRWIHIMTQNERELNNKRVYQPKYQLWRKKVFKRDNYTCQVCNDDTGGNLVAHHIYNWSSYKKLRFTISNGVTFCRNCHKEFHHKYGIKNNTRKQLNDFKRISSYE